MAAFLQTILSYAFSWLKSFVCWFKFHWNSCLSINWQQTIIGWDNGLAPNRQQAIIWTNADPIHWCIYAALRGDELISLHALKNESYHEANFVITDGTDGCLGTGIYHKKTVLIKLASWQPVVFSETIYLDVAIAAHMLHPVDEFRDASFTHLKANIQWTLTHCGLVTPYGGKDLGQHWFR